MRFLYFLNNLEKQAQRLSEEINEHNQKYLFRSLAKEICIYFF